MTGFCFNKTAISMLSGAVLASMSLSATAGVSYFNIGYYTDAGNTATIKVQGATVSTYATAFSVDWQATGPGGIASAPLPPNHGDPFVSFCLDANVYLGSGWFKSGGFSDVTLTSQSAPAVRQADGLYRAANLYSHYASGILNANGTWANKTDGAALQLAIWEVLYEKGTTYSIDRDVNRTDANQFYVSSVSQAIRDRANYMLANNSSAAYSIDTTFWNAVTDSTGNTSLSLIHI